MIARVATYTDLKGVIDDGSVERMTAVVSSMPGYVSGFRLDDPASNESIMVTVFEDAPTLQDAGKALANEAAAQRVHIEPDVVEYFDATKF